MIKICHISTVHLGLDDRIFYKECVSLANAGYDVSLVINHDINETRNGVKIIALQKSSGRLNRIFVKSFVALKKALKTKSKLYHFHDPELIFIGVILRVLGKKVIFDSHENVTKQIESKNWIGNNTVRKAVAKIYRFVELFGIWTFNSVISVTPEIVKFLSVKKGVLIRNFPIVSLIENSNKGKGNKETTLVYAGGLTRLRGIKELCIALNSVQKPVKLQLLGPWESDEYKEECMSVCPSKIDYVGMLPMEDVYPYMKASDIGIATLYPEKNYLNSLPIKAFEYMACGMPIIMSDFPYWIEEFDGCAVFVNPKSPEDIADKINSLIADEKEITALGNKGKELVDTKFSWESEAKILVKLYDKILKQNKV
jgi:glycosyltransferase involved in cell wall biosynthesis